MIFIVVDLTEGVPDRLVGPPLYRPSQIDADDLSEHSGIDVIFKTNDIFHVKSLHFLSITGSDKSSSFIACLCTAVFYVYV